MSDGAVLYLLGAGASAKTLPVSGAMEESLKLFINEWMFAKIESYLKAKFAGDELAKHEDYKKEFLEAADRVKGLAARYGSLDTYARKLHLRGDADEFKKLKAFISAYFIAIQGVKGIDYRCDMFLGDVLTASAHTQEIPKTIQIVTWNYDTQLEASYFGFCQDSDYTWNYLHDRLLHLNGWCGSVINEGYGDDFTLQGPDAVVRAIQRYHEYIHEPNKDLRLSFAFERDPPIGLTMGFPRRYGNVETLIVIGYSFPVLNRKVDRELFAAMPKLKRIHVQVTSEYRSEVSSTLVELAKGKVVILRDYLGRFYIPEEANVY
jgi:hypothetical protein